MSRLRFDLEQLEKEANIFSLFLEGYKVTTSPSGVSFDRELFEDLNISILILDFKMFVFKYTKIIKYFYCL